MFLGSIKSMWNLEKMFVINYDFEYLPVISHCRLPALWISRNEGGDSAIA